MAAAKDQLDDAQCKALEEEKEQLEKEQKLLNIDIRAMTLEMKRRSGEPAPGEPSALAALQQLSELSAELTQLQLEEVTFHLLSAQRGVSVTHWRVRVVSNAADAEICVEYDTTKDELGSRCSGLELVDFSPSLGALVDAAEEHPRLVLFGLYQLGLLAAERRRALGDAAPAEHAQPARLPLPGGKQLVWSIEMVPGEDRYRRSVVMEDKKGRQSPLPPVLLELLEEQGVQALVDYVQTLQR